MNIDKLFFDKKLLNKKYNYFIKKSLLKKIQPDDDLIKSHLEKAKHNLLFYEKNKDENLFNDWLVVILYYSLYHAVLALIVNKNFVSKNHTASLIFLIKHYVNFKDEIILLHNLSIQKEDAELYTELKEERHKASYDTKTNFEDQIIKSYKIRIIDFIQKVENIINDG